MMQFGNLTYRYERGVSATRLVLFPAADSPAMMLGVPDLGGVPDE